MQSITLVASNTDLVARYDVPAPDTVACANRLEFRVAQGVACPPDLRDGEEVVEVREVWAGGSRVYGRTTCKVLERHVEVSATSTPASRCKPGTVPLSAQNIDHVIHDLAPTLDSEVPLS